MKPLSTDISEIRSRYDVVIVGSGYGGGVSAARLSAAGRKVCVLERGREFLPGDFPARFPQLRKELQVTGAGMHMGSATALYDIRLGSDMHVLVGCGLGGGSLVNAAVAFRPDSRVFEDEVWPGQLRQDGLLDEGYARAARWLRPARYEDAENVTKFKVFQKSGEGVGAEPVKAPVAVSFEDHVNPAGVEQAACTLCGDCCAGCNVGAKNTVAMTYLPFAQKNGAELFTEASVHSVEKVDGGWRVYFGTAGEKHKNQERPENFVEADIVILSAGTLGSTEILFRSNEHGLAVSDKLGQRFSANGDMICFGYDADETVNAIGVGDPPKAELPTVGASVTGQLELVDKEDLTKSMVIQEGVLPSAIAPLLPVFFIPGGRLLGAAKALIAGVYKGPLARTQTFFVTSHDSASGEMKMKDGNLALEWPGVRNEPVYKRIDETMEKVTGAVGSDYVQNPLSETVAGAKPATAHPLGGCAMAADSTKGVVNHKGQVFDPKGNDTAVHEGLYVTDGSIIPRSLGANPLFTITALSERNMIHLCRDKGWSIEDPASMNEQAAE